ncbi:MAG: cytochrome c family protein [Rhizobiaceae bacterium]
MTFAARSPNKTMILAAFTALALSAPAFAEDGDVTAGEKVFKKCTACHTIGDEAKNKVGPVLNAVFGRAAGTFEGFKYGKSIVAAGENGLVWDEEQVFTYLENPKKFLREYLGDKKAKTKMTFRLKKEKDRRNVIAYLMTFSPDYQSTAATE